MSNNTSNTVVVGVSLVVLAAIIIGAFTFYGDAKAQAVTITQHETRLINAEQDVRTVSQNIADIKTTVVVNKTLLEAIGTRLERMENRK